MLVECPGPRSEPALRGGAAATVCASRDTSRTTRTRPSRSSFRMSSIWWSSTCSPRSFDSRQHDRHMSGVRSPQNAPGAGMRNHHMRRREVREHLRERHERSGASHSRSGARGTMLHDERVRGQRSEPAYEPIERLLMRPHSHEDQSSADLASRLARYRPASPPTSPCSPLAPPRDPLAHRPTQFAGHAADASRPRSSWSHRAARHAS
jgi:hypothetical protein